jgi:MFS family permease
MITGNTVMSTTSIHVTLPKALKEHIEKRVAEGEFTSPSDYVRALVRSERDHATFTQVSIAGVLLFGASYGGFLPTALVYLRKVYPFRKSHSQHDFLGGLGIAEGSIASGAIAIAPALGPTAPLVMAAGSADTGMLLW